MMDLLKGYQTFLKSQNKEESTIRMYVHEVKQFSYWLHTQQKDFKQLHPDDFVRFRDWLIDKGMKAATINKSLSTLRSFFAWAKNNGLIQINLPEKIRLHEDKRNKQPKWLSHEEEIQLLQVAALEKSPFKKARNEALIYVMLYAGLRIEELSQLHISSFTEKTLLVFDDGRLAREVPVIPKLMEKKLTWISFRNKVNKQVYKDSPFLFVTERSGRMQPRSIQFVIEGFSEKLGSTITCQLLRNTYCRRLVEEGRTVEEVKQYAGHKSIVTSYKYFW
jgi:site-specific recombinase XerD